MDFYSLFELAQIKAINVAIEPTLESIYRIKCRDYSQQFHTPLHVVMNDLDSMMVLQALYETQYPPSIVDDELEDLLDKLQKIKDPTYSRMTQQETEDLVDAVLNKELIRLAKKKPITQQTIQEDIKANDIKTQKTTSQPKSGSMQFNDLEASDSKIEGSKGNFDS